VNAAAMYSCSDSARVILGSCGKKNETTSAARLVKLADVDDNFCDAGSDGQRQKFVVKARDCLRGQRPSYSPPSRWSAR